ncbi:MAG: hypothetical protein V1885_03085 [Candidatus Brennerbacteria bacterium]
MEHGKFEAPTSPEDQEKMELLAREVEGILFADSVSHDITRHADEEVNAELAKEEGAKMLRRFAEQDVKFVEEKFGEMFGDPESLKTLFDKFEKDFHWPVSKSRAMVGVLRHALNEIYYRARFHAPDEHDPHPKGSTRDTAERLLTIISEDYGAEAMCEVEPLVRLYVEKGSELIKESKTPSENAGEEQVDV